jgi:hypothetical protein
MVMVSGQSTKTVVVERVDVSSGYDAGSVISGAVAISLEAGADPGALFFSTRSIPGLSDALDEG